ncbi:hypothetical protein TNCT_375331 [Trichonephila clavata]|uniref:Uncharacterized protein n=1 Tax=Trichonephila clavata TaxID=2740835 RepID=A0A8X6KB28_TRICU|nr:hypothetical protein TNCT_375331 [Trichonephila clavata]
MSSQCRSSVDVHSVRHLECRPEVEANVFHPTHLINFRACRFFFVCGRYLGPTHPLDGNVPSSVDDPLRLKTRAISPRLFSETDLDLGDGAALSSVGCRPLLYGK